MTTLRNVLVIMENDRLVGTQIVGEADGANTTSPMQREASAIAARLRAGPSQTLHELRMAVPADLSAPGVRERFHASLAEKIRRQK
jgi:hypothetical protein